jgi:hypothetical protein
MLYAHCTLHVRCAGLGFPLSLLVRVVEKVILDCTGFVHFRHACATGGFYYCFNAVMAHVACFGAAALYSAYATGTAPDHESYSATGGIYTGANTSNTTLANFTAPLSTNGTVADDAGARSGKIDDATLFTVVGTLSAVYAIAYIGLLLTMKREYVGTFVSTQTGCAYARSYFLDHAGDDARRINIFFMNERQWRSIRDLVRQWVLGAYATWLQLSPVWFTNALRTLIPDDFMPAPVVQQMDAQAPGGRRRTLENMGTLRRVSLALSGTEELEAAESSAPLSAPAADSQGQRAGASGLHAVPVGAAVGRLTGQQ